MRVDLDKNLDKDVFHTIKTTIGYPRKLVRNKISHVNFSKLGQITKKLTILGRLFSYSELLAHISQIIEIK